MRFFLLRGVKADMPTGALSAILRKSKPSAMGFFLLGALAYKLLSSEPTGRWTFDSFPPPESFHPYSDAGDTILLKSCHPYSDDEITPLGRQLRCEISPTRRSAPLMGLLPLGGTRSSLQFILDSNSEYRHPICRWVTSLHQTLFCRFSGTWLLVTYSINEGFLFWIILFMY